MVIIIETKSKITMSKNKKSNLSPSDYKKFYDIAMENIKITYEYATESDGYKFDDMLRYSGELDFIIYQSLKFHSISKLAAHFLHGIATRHPFMDGNKRTALIMGLILMKQEIKDPSLKDKILKNIYAIMQIFNEYPDNYIVKFMLETAENKEKKHSIEEIEIFLKKIISI